MSLPISQISFIILSDLVHCISSFYHRPFLLRLTFLNRMLLRITSINLNSSLFIHIIITPLSLIIFICLSVIVTLIAFFIFPNNCLLMLISYRINTYLNICIIFKYSTSVNLSCAELVSVHEQFIQYTQLTKKVSLSQFHST